LEKGQVKDWIRAKICAWKRTNKGLDKRAKSVLGNGQIKVWIRVKTVLGKEQIKN
jgi:hypothetical protein